MELLSLKINKEKEQHIYDKIKMLTNLNNNNIYIKIDSNSKDIINVNYGVKYASSKKKSLEEIYQLIIDFIIIYVEQLSIDYFIDNYSYFDTEEVQEIKNKIKEEIINDIKLNIVIKEKLIEFRTYSSVLNIDGFIKFRLKFLNEYSKQIVEKCIDEYLMKKEYYEFINILKYFSEYDSIEGITVNILYKHDKLQIYNDKMEKINNYIDQELSEEFDKINIQYDENIISLLLAICPKKIIIHTKLEDKNTIYKNTLEIIHKLFGDKVESCKGCKYCDIKNN